jgi:hypothetical protein
MAHFVINNGGDLMANNHFQVTVPWTKNLKYDT